MSGLTADAKTLIDHARADTQVRTAVPSPRTGSSRLNAWCLEPPAVHVKPGTAQH
jgi:hypothetical protein